MSRFRAEDNVRLVGEIQKLVSAFMVKLYEYTYGPEWYLLKGETGTPDTYDVQHFVKFLAYDTTVAGGEEYPEIWKIFRKRYRDIIPNDKAYRRLLVNCLKIRNTVTGHQSEQNLNNAEGFNQFLRYANTFVGVLHPFRKIEELFSENGISYYDELQQLIKMYVSEDRYSLDTIRLDLGEQYSYISDTEILDICVENKYGIYGDLVAASNYERLLADVERSLSEKINKKPIKRKRRIGRGNYLVMVFLLLIIVALAYPSYMYIYRKLNATDRYTGVSNGVSLGAEVFVASAGIEDDVISIELRLSNSDGGRAEVFESRIVKIKVYDKAHSESESFSVTIPEIALAAGETRGLIYYFKLNETQKRFFNSNKLSASEFFIA